ncbi:AraC family transcriptional regulator [Butyricicoccus sp.]|uniref:AraC family transcriptional regulator n=1 Tax=Butyricicoccus sp. TaxID=2049021 RepID=UPI003F16A95E
MDSGVYAPSFMDFVVPSNFAKRALYYALQFGHYYCDEQYCIQRDSLDQFLFVYVKAGQLWVETRGKTFVAERDQVILLDCHFAHKYYCKEPSEFLWFHFNGSSSLHYSEYLYEQSGLVHTGEHVKHTHQSFARVLSGSQAIPNNEHVVSMNIAGILAALASPDNHTDIQHDLEPAVQYIRNHYTEEIPLNTLADLCAMSPSHFIRSFGKYLNRTPHEYLLAYRLQQSKRLLITTNDTVESIAERCGFNSASHFARAFRKSTGVSPTVFRTSF